jgi:hypothetical protein
MTTHIARAKAQAAHIDTEGYAHPAYEKAALRGILHALLALHEQNEAGQFSEAAKDGATNLRTRATKNIATLKEPK